MNQIVGAETLFIVSQTIDANGGFIMDNRHLTSDAVLQLLLRVLTLFV